MDRRQLFQTGAGVGAAFVAERVAAAEALLSAKQKPLPLFFKGRFNGGPFNGFEVDIAVNRTRVRGFARNEAVTQAVRLEKGRLKNNLLTAQFFHPNDPCAEEPRLGTLTAKVRGNKLAGRYGVDDSAVSGEFGIITAERVRLSRQRMKTLAGIYEATGIQGEDIEIGGARIKLLPDGRYEVDGIVGKGNCPRRQSGIWGMERADEICISPTFICYDKTLICAAHVLMCPGVIEAPVLPSPGPRQVLIHHPFLGFHGLGEKRGR